MAFCFYAETVHFLLQNFLISAFWNHKNKEIVLRGVDVKSHIYST